MKTLLALAAFLKSAFEIVGRILGRIEREDAQRAGRNEVLAPAYKDQAEKADENARIAARHDTVDDVARRMRDRSF